MPRKRPLRDGRGGAAGTSRVKLSRRSLLIGGGAGLGLLIVWGVWPRAYAPNLAAAPGETIF
ncbi:MAG: hypothetical protein DI607_04955, partial [Sphingomonas hengshuiensis]